MIKILNFKYIGLAEKHYYNIESYLMNSLKFYLKCCYEINPLLNKNLIDLKIVDNINFSTKKSLFSAISSLRYESINKEHIFDIQCIEPEFIKNAKILSDLFENMLDVKSDIYIKKIVVAFPKELEKIFNKIKSKIENLLILSKVFKKIFNYNKFNKTGINKWTAYDFCQQLNINVCPYCNRMYTSTIRNSEKNIIRPALDHYIPQSKCPIFGLSFYNLIPSCTNCNSYIKRDDKKFTFDEDVLNKYMHPYIDDENFKFQFRPFDISVYNGNKEEISIEVEKPIAPKIKNTLDFFSVSIIYQAHKNMVSTLILKRLEYNDTNLDMISKIIGRGKEEILNSVFGVTDDEEIVDQSLGKLRSDIIEQLKNLTTQK
ncbi:hypothetical protein PDN18_25615 [Bacillus cereus]|nr:hypothetical protein [Bacillus cereus]